MSFINPVKDSEIKKPLLSNTVKIESNKNDDVLCPYNGVIVQYNPDECNGKLTIQHEVNDEIIYWRRHDDG